VHTRPAPAGRGWSAAASSVFASRDRPSSGRHVVLWGRIPRGNGGRVAAVLLVDNAAQPMQAAPVAALKGIAVSGNASKLHVIFTHFD
jgi:hypothetical protein